MYKLLLVSDQEDVLDAYEQLHNWGYNGFNKPHVRRDPEGAKEALQKHHVDGIGIALEAEKEKELMEFLQQEYPMLPVFAVSASPQEALEYLGELKTLLNWLRLDFSSDNFTEHQLMLRARRRFFRDMVSSDSFTKEKLFRQMRLLRSRMDPDKPCVLMDLEQITFEDERPVDLCENSDSLLERELYQSFGGDVKGYHVLPLVTEDGNLYVLAGALRNEEQEEDMTTVLNRSVQEGLEHAEEYRGLHLRVRMVQIYPSFYAFCSDYAG